MKRDRVTEQKKLGLWGRLKRWRSPTSGALVRGFNAADLEAVERLLLEADFGVPATMDLWTALEDGVRAGRLKIGGRPPRRARRRGSRSCWRRPGRSGRDRARRRRGRRWCWSWASTAWGRPPPCAKLAHRLQGAGAEGPARRGRHLARRRHRAARGLGGAARRAVRVRRRRAAIRRRWRSTRSRRPSPAAPTPSSWTPPAGCTRRRA